MREWDVDGASTLVVELGVRYRAECLWGDRLHIEILAGAVRSRGCELLYRVTGTDDGRTVAEAATGLVFVDPVDGHLVAVPPRLRALLEGLVEV
jgi:acyl-CoA thioesterase FadM